MQAPWDSDGAIGLSLLQMIARETNDGIWVLDVATDQAYYSPRWLELLGFGPGELPGALSTFIDRIHPHDVNRIIRAIEAHKQERLPDYREEFRLRHKDGSWRKILSRGVMLRDAAGKVVHMAGTHTDLSAQAREARRLEDLVRDRTVKLKAARDQAELNSAAAIKFLSTASHDIRQPLQATALLLGSLAQEVVTTRGQATLKAMENSLAASLELLDALLEFSRLDAGALRPSFTAVDLGALALRVSEPFTTEVGIKGVKLRVVPTSLAVWSDPQLLGRILRNLLANAVQYTARGTILVGFRRRGDRVLLQVWDTGRGIPPEQCQQIFWEFYQVTTRRPSSRGGLGLGLAIAKRLSDLLKHRIEVTSWPGRGSVFSVEMPTTPRLVTQPALTQSLPVAADPIFAGKLIAVLENDPAVAAALGQLLTSWGARSVVAADDAAILQALAGRCPDMMIIDRYLADGRDGFAAASAVEQAFGHPIPSLVLTGDYDISSLTDVNRDRRRVLQKPAMPVVLHALLRAELSGAAHSTPDWPPAI